MRMRPLAAFPGEVRRRVRGVLTDIDDTPTAEGRLTAEAYAALAALQAAGLLVVAAHGIDIDAARDTLVFAGDSPNDAPMFGVFDNAVGVANVRAFEGRLAAEPRWVTEAPCGAGFAALAAALAVALVGAG